MENIIIITLAFIVAFTVTMLLVYKKAIKIMRNQVSQCTETCEKMTTWIKVNTAFQTVYKLNGVLNMIRITWNTENPQLRKHYIETACSLVNNLKSIDYVKIVAEVTKEDIVDPTESTNGENIADCYEQLLEQFMYMEPEMGMEEIVRRINDCFDIIMRYHPNHLLAEKLPDEFGQTNISLGFQRLFLFFYLQSIFFGLVLDII